MLIDIDFAHNHNDVQTHQTLERQPTIFEFGPNLNLKDLRTNLINLTLDMPHASD